MKCQLHLVAFADPGGAKLAQYRGGVPSRAAAPCVAIASERRTDSKVFTGSEVEDDRRPAKIARERAMIFLEGGR
jgi:hypothetical protein